MERHRLRLRRRQLFRSRTLTVDPYPFFDHLREQCPVLREPHSGVFMVTGYGEAIEVCRDHAEFSSCNAVSGPFVKFSVPVEGADISRVIEAHRYELPFSDQLPSFDQPLHTAHRELLMRLITPKRLKENEEFMWRLADRQIDEIVAHGWCEFIGEFAQPFTLLVIADLLSRLAPERGLETATSHHAGGPGRDLRSRRTMRRPRLGSEVSQMRRQIVITSVMCIAVAALLSACSSSSKTSTAVTTTTGRATPTTPPPNATLRVVTNAKLAKPIIVDSAGRTVYMYAPDGSSTTSKVPAALKTAWPPVVVTGTVIAGSGLSAAKLAAHPQTGGSLQVAYGGHLLYTFANDKAPGDATGQGLGGIWFTVTPAGAKNA